MSDSTDSSEIFVDVAEETESKGPNVSGATKLLLDKIEEFKKQHYREEIAFYTQVIPMCPDTEQTLLSMVYQKRAAAYSKSNNNENCVCDCTEVLKLDPTNIKALTLRAKALSKLENYVLALEDIIALEILDESDQLDSLFVESVRDNLVVQNLSDLNKNLVFDLPSKTFIDNYITAFCDDPYNDEFAQSLMRSDENTGLEMALKCIRDKNYDAVEKACKEELDKTDNSLARSTLASNLLGTFALLRRNYTEAIKNLTDVIDTPGVSNRLIVNALVKRAAVYMLQTQTKKSLEDFKRGEEIDPNSSVVYHHRGYCKMVYNKNNFSKEKIVEDFRKAVELNPEFIFSNICLRYAQYQHAERISNETDVKKHMRELEQVVIKHLDNAASSQVFYFDNLINENWSYFEEADSLYKKALEVHPENPAFLVGRGLIAMFWKKSVDDAVSFIGQALKIDPKFTEANVSLALIYLQIGKFDDAVLCFEKVLNNINYLCGIDGLKGVLYSIHLARAGSAAVKRVG